MAILVEGTVSDIAAKNLHIGYGRSSQFVGSVALQGLPDMDKFHFDVTADKLVVNAYDIAHTRIPPFSSEQFVELPEFLNNLTTINILVQFAAAFPTWQPTERW